MTKLGERLLKSAQEARAIARGEMEPGRMATSLHRDHRKLVLIKYQI